MCYIHNMELPVAQNIRQLRQLKGLTLQELAEKAGLNRIAIRKIENGESAPKTETLQRIAEALSVSLFDLMTPIETLKNVRFRSRKRLNARDYVISEVARRLKDFAWLEETLGDSARYSLRDFLPTKGKRPEEVAAKVREHFGLDDTPIHNICGLLEHQGIKVILLDVSSDDFFGLSVGKEDGGPAIAINTWERISVERRIFSAAHELGHLVLHLQDFDLGEKEELPAHEKEADRFASHFLMPNQAFQKEWSATAGLHVVDRVLQVKQVFRVSYRAVLYRLVENKELNAKVWGWFQTEYGRLYNGRRLLKADEPSPLNEIAFPGPLRSYEPDSVAAHDLKEARLYRLVATALDEEKITMSRGAEILKMKLVEFRKLADAWHFARP